MIDIRLGLENVELVNRKLERVEREMVRDNDVLKVAVGIHSRIIARTLAGKDVKGKRFKPYSPKYAKYRKKHKRPISRVDLNFSGKMQAAIDEKIIGPLRARIGFIDAHQAAKAHGHNTGFLGRGPKRLWFAVNDQDAAFARAEILKYINGRIRLI